MTAKEPNVKRLARMLPMLVLCLSCAPQAKAPERKVDVDAEVRQATEHYADLVRRMDSPGIAAMFTDEGELVTEGQKPVRGSKEIQKFLDTFKQYQVQSESLTTQTVHGNPSSAHSTGIYDQSVRLPTGNVAEVHGSFAADWVRGSDDVWRMRRMAAFPDKESRAAAASQKN